MDHRDATRVSAIDADAARADGGGGGAVAVEPLQLAQSGREHAQCAALREIARRRLFTTDRRLRRISHPQTHEGLELQLRRATASDAQQRVIIVGGAAARVVGAEPASERLQCARHRR